MKIPSQSAFFSLLTFMFLLWNIKGKQTQRTPICQAINQIEKTSDHYSFAALMTEEEASALHTKFQQIDKQQYLEIVKTKGLGIYNPYANEDSFQMDMHWSNLNVHRQFFLQTFSDPELTTQTLSLLEDMIRDIQNCPSVESISDAWIFLQYYAPNEQDLHLDPVKLEDIGVERIRATFSIAQEGTLFAKTRGMDMDIIKTPRGSVAIFNRHEAFHARPPLSNENRVTFIVDFHLKPKTNKRWCRVLENGEYSFDECPNNKETEEHLKLPSLN